MAIPAWAGELFPSIEAWLEFHDHLRAVLPAVDPTAQLAEDRPFVFVQIDGRSMTLAIEDLAHHCRDSEDPAEIIEAWADAAASTLRQLRAQATMTWDEVAPSLRVQLYNDQRHAAIPMIARRVAEDLWLALVLDTAEAIKILTDVVVAPWAQSEDVLFERAMANVMNDVEVAPGPARVPPPLRICSSDDDYTAVAAYLTLDELVGKPRHGALVMFPTRYTASYLPIDEAVPAAPYQILLTGSRRNFEAGDGALTPNLYWWRDGELVSIPVLSVGENLVAMWPEPLKPMLAST